MLGGIAVKFGNMQGKLSGNIFWHVYFSLLDLCSRDAQFSYDLFTLTNIKTEKTIPRQVRVEPVQSVTTFVTMVIAGEILPLYYLFIVFNFISVFCTRSL